MENLSVQQLANLAAKLERMAESINDFQTEHWSNLSEQQQFKLIEAERNLLLRVQDINAETIIVMANDASVFMNEISGITDQINHSLDQIANINKAIEIASGVVILAGTIASKNPAAIAAAVQGLAGILTD